MRLDYRGNVFKMRITFDKTPNLNRSMAFYPLEKVSNLHDNYRQTFRLEGGYHLLLLQHEGEPTLLDNICPHAGYPMHEGRIIDGKLRCPMHGYLFDIHNGDCVLSIEGPCRGINVYTLETRGDDIGVVL